MSETPIADVFVRHPVHAWFERIATLTMIVCLVLWAGHIVEAWWALGHVPLTALSMVGMVFVGIIGADVVSGFFHFFFDRFLSTTTPVIGPSFVAPFRQHHSDPVDITRHSLSATTGNTALAMVVPLKIVIWFVPLGHLGGVLLATSLLSFFVFLLFTNQFHCWAHRVHVPRFVAALQRRGWMLSQAHHLKHHTFPYDMNYCITVGWMNPIARSLRVWRGLEMLFCGLGMKRHGEPHAWEHDPTSSAFEERNEFVKVGFADHVPPVAADGPLISSSEDSSTSSFLSAAKQ
jgi:plasmanylethanolamine desaturase